MMPRRGVLGLLAGSMAAVLAGCGSTIRPRYKMTVEVETPEGLKTASSVREIRVRTPPSVPMLGEDKGSVRVKGEAVALDLPNGRTLFALLTNGDGNVDYAGRDVWFLFRELGEAAPDGVIELWPAMPKTKAPRIDNPLPMLVAFRNVADPKTVEQVDPTNLAAQFGAGVRLKRIWVEITDDAVTTGIEKRLAWLEAQRGSLRMDALNSPPPPGTPLPFGANLTEGDFRRTNNL